MTIKKSRVATFLKNECNLRLKVVTRHPVARNSELCNLGRSLWKNGYIKKACSTCKIVYFSMNQAPASTCAVQEVGQRKKMKQSSKHHQLEAYRIQSLVLSQCLGGSTVFDRNKPHNNNYSKIGSNDSK